MGRYEYASGQYHNLVSSKKRPVKVKAFMKALGHRIVAVGANLKVGSLGSSHNQLEEFWHHVEEQTEGGCMV